MTHILHVRPTPTTPNTIYHNGDHTIVSVLIEGSLKNMLRNLLQKSMLFNLKRVEKHNHSLPTELTN